MFHGNAYFFWYDFGFASHTWLSFEMLKINLQWGNTLRLTQSVQSSAYSFTALGQWYTCIMWRLSKKKKKLLKLKVFRLCEFHAFSYVF